MHGGGGGGGRDVAQFLQHIIRQGIEGLLARDSQELLFYVLLNSLLSTVQI